MKARNAEGESGTFNTAFDLFDPVERRAYECARRCARPHGRRKHLLVAFFLAIAEYEERTGQLFTADMVAGMVMGSGYRMPLGELPPEMEYAEIVTGAAEKPSSEELGATFMEDRGNLFG